MARLTLKEGVRNASLWPVNLARDLARRSGRLAGIVTNPPSSGRGTTLLPWLHALVWAVFDVVGGPELVQILLRMATDTRPLAPDEVIMAQRIFGPAGIRYGDVRVAQGGVLNSVFRRNKNRAFATWHTINLPLERDHDLVLLMHELTHVFQYERVGSVYIGQGLWAQRRYGRAAYHYGGAERLAGDRLAGKRLRDYNREQQGSIVQDYCHHLIAGDDASAFEHFIADLREGVL